MKIHWVPVKRLFRQLMGAVGLFAASLIGPAAISAGTSDAEIYRSLFDKEFIPITRALVKTPTYRGDGMTEDQFAENIERVRHRPPVLQANAVRLAASLNRLVGNAVVAVELDAGRGQPGTITDDAVLPSCNVA